MKIEKIKVDEIIPYADNAKLHPERQIEQIRSSILEFGFNDPIAIDENNVVIEGNGRLMAIKDLGFKEVDCIRIEGLTEDQKRAYILVHNQLTMNTGFDIEKLEFELSRIDFNMSDFGFDNFDFSEEDFGTDFELPEGDKNKICTMSFTLHEEQKRLIEQAMERVANEVSETFGNTNKNGNALYEVVRQWQNRR